MRVQDSAVNERYAQALFNVAKRQGNLDAVKNDSEQLLVLLKRDNNKLGLFFGGPQFTKARKLELIRKFFQGNVEKIVSQLLELLLVKGRIEYTRSIFTRFVELAEMDQGIRYAEVASAIELTAEQSQRLQKALEAYTSSQLRIKFHVEPALIGGVRFSMGDLLIDDSVKGKLDRLKFQLQRGARA